MKVKYNVKDHNLILGHSDHVLKHGVNEVADDHWHGDGSQHKPGMKNHPHVQHLLALELKDKEGKKYAMALEVVEDEKPAEKKSKK